MRALTGDDPRQAAIARTVLTEPFLLSPSVLVEVEWVLRSQFGWSREQIGAALTELVDLPALAEVPPEIEWAIARFMAGADFADMIHLASAPAATCFVTFDRRIEKCAGPDSPLPIETLA